jgi:MFS family permease
VVGDDFLLANDVPSSGSRANIQRTLIRPTRTWHRFSVFFTTAQVLKNQAQQQVKSAPSLQRRSKLLVVSSIFMGAPNYNQVPAGEAAIDDADVLETTSASDEDDESEAISPSHSHRLTVDDAIERLGMGRFQLIVLIAAGMCFAADAMQVILLTFLSEVLRIEWSLSHHETAFITSTLFIGAIFGTLFLGPLADRRGRKPVFILTGSIISIFGLAVSLCTNYWALLCMLFMVGFGAGGLTVPFDILAECIPSNTRGKNLLIIEYFWTVGVLFVVVMAYIFLGKEEGNWRLFVCVCTLPCLASVIVGVLCVPESPRWLCTMGRSDDALQILRTAAVINGHDAQFIFPEGTEIVDEAKEEPNFCELFTPKWRWTTLMLWGTWGAYAFGYYGVIMLITEIFENVQGDTSNDVRTHPKYNFDFGAIFVSSSAELVGASLAILGVDRVGRIPVQIVSYSAAGLSVCALAVLASNGGGRSALISLGFVARIFEMSGSCVTWVSTAEILTTEVRTTGHSTANAVARIGSLFAPFLIVGNSSVAKKGVIMLAIHCITVAFVSQLPETKGVHMGVASIPVLSEDDDDMARESADEGSSGQLEHPDHLIAYFSI